MNVSLLREFRLSFREGLGIRCGADGAFVGEVGLIERIGNEWVPRKCEELSAALSKTYGLPVDVSAKARGVAAVARALNEGDVARAQITMLFAHFPDPPNLAKRAPSPSETVKLALELDWAGLLKINRRHYPAKSPGGKVANSRRRTRSRIRKAISRTRPIIVAIYRERGGEQREVLWGLQWNPRRSRQKGKRREVPPRR
jgi:hypothetical protein